MRGVVIVGLDVELVGLVPLISMEGRSCSAPLKLGEEEPPEVPPRPNP